MSLDPRPLTAAITAFAQANGIDQNVATLALTNAWHLAQLIKIRAAATDPVMQDLIDLLIARAPR